MTIIRYTITDFIPYYKRKL